MGRGEPSDYLSRVYGARSRDELRAIYDDWAASYDGDLAGWGYIGPALVVGLIARHLKPGEGPLLDAGCGPGGLGSLLHCLGYRELVAIDLSPGMLERARARGVYDACREMALGEALDFPDGRFAMTIAAGVFTAGHAGPEAFDELLRVTRPGGRLLFSLSEAVYEEGGFRSRLEALERDSRIAPLDASDWTRVMTAYPGESPPRHRIFVYRVS